MSDANDVHSFHVLPIHTTVQLSRLIYRGAEDETAGVVQLKRELTDVASVTLMATAGNMAHILQSFRGSKIFESLQNPLGARLAIPFLQEAEIIALLPKLFVLERYTHR